MAKEWQELTKLTGGAPIVVETVRLVDSDIVIKGEFDLPPIARLTSEDQVFIAAFVRAHGSIKEMESLFGVSYPTIKSRLNRIGGMLEFIKVEAVSPRSEVLSRLERGEVSVKEALDELRNLSDSKREE